MKIILGCDIVKISRIKKLMKNKTLIKNIFHPSEIEIFDPPHIAGIFALKEAYIKALGLRVNQWLDIEVRYENSGKPLISSRGDQNNYLMVECSVSHEEEYAVAVVFGLKNE